MIVHKDDAGRRLHDGRLEHFTRHDGTSIQAAQADEIVTEDAFAGVEHQHHERLLHRVKPRCLRDVFPPVFDGLLRIIDQFGGHTFPDTDHLELMGQIF